MEDKPWYNDRDFWRAYLTTPATHRFNLTLGIGYDFARQIRDCYSHFPHPFLMDVKGIACIHREGDGGGVQFHLAPWTQAYQWTESPSVNTSSKASRRRLSRIPAEAPEISGLTFRVHGESGVAEGQLRSLKAAAKECEVQCGAHGTARISGLSEVPAGLPEPQAFEVSGIVK